MATCAQKYVTQQSSILQLSRQHCISPAFPVMKYMLSTLERYQTLHEQRRHPLSSRSDKSSFILQQPGVREGLTVKGNHVVSSSARGLTEGHSTVQLVSGTELNEPGDFQQLADSDGLLSIVGFGSLLSSRSAKYTFPDLQNFRVARLDGFRRVFAHVAPVFLVRGIANLETREMSSLSVEPCEGESILVTMFEIDVSEVPAFIEREHEFRFLTVYPESVDLPTRPRPAVVCSRYSDEEYRRVRCKGSEEEFEQRYGRFGIQRIWVDDVLPCRTYLRHCVLAAQNLSPEAYASFLDHTFLANRRTTIRQHLQANPQIMLELPPPELAERYGG